MAAEPVCEVVSSADAYRVITSAYADMRDVGELVRSLPGGSLVRLAQACRTLLPLTEAEILRRQ